MNIFKILLHRCKNNLSYIEGTSFVTGKGKIWKNYRCNICGKIYTSSGRKLHRVFTCDDLPIKINL